MNSASFPSVYLFFIFIWLIGVPFFFVGISSLLEHRLFRRYLLPLRCCENTHNTASNHNTMACALLTSLQLFLNLFPTQSIWCSSLPDHFLKVHWCPSFCTEPWSQHDFDWYNMFSVTCSIITVAFTYKHWYFFLFSDDNICICSMLFPSCIWNMSLYFSDTFVTVKQSS